MKLLFDQNLSPRLVGLIADLFPGSHHVCQVGLERAFDEDVWAFAGANHYVIVSKDVDFSDLSAIRGFPPKLIWLRLGNCTTRQVELCLRGNQQAIIAIDTDGSIGVLALY